MATLKIISNKDCKLYIDQEFVCDMSAKNHWDGSGDLQQFLETSTWFQIYEV